MPMNHVRSAFELDAARRELGVFGCDVSNAEVENRFRARFLALGGQEQTRAAAIEEREIAERVEMAEAEHAAVPRFRCLDVPHAARDLADRAQLSGLSRHRFLLRCRRAPQRAVTRRAAPMLESASVGEAELRDRVRDVKLHGVEANAAQLRDRAVAQAVAHEVHDPPLGRGEHVVVARPASRSSYRHRGGW
jgi:hypothetical protein